MIRSFGGAALAALIAAPAASAQESSAPAGDAGLATAIFAGGCFWCVEQAFDEVEGVVETTSGYTGGTVEAPTYEQVSAGGTGHYEAVRVRYDPARVGYAELVEDFWRNVDPLDAGGQFCDRGTSYLSAVFVASEEERRAAEESRAAVAERLGGPVATEILPAAPFHPAEEYHQDDYLKNPVLYRFYKWRCGRQQRLEAVWGEEAGGAS